MVRYAIRREATTRRRGDKVGKGLASGTTVCRRFKTTNVDKVEELKG